MKCPICKGKGEINYPKNNLRLLRERAVKILRKNGFGLRETQRLVGYKSPHSIQHLEGGG
jgi:hypothetical protein